MDAYIPLAVWLLSAAVCLYIAKVRHIKPTLMWELIVAVLGPVAIPLVLFIAKPNTRHQAI